MLTNVYVAKMNPFGMAESKNFCSHACYIRHWYEGFAIERESG